MTVLGVIIARGGSKRLPGKNLRQLGGRPLIGWTIAAALAAKRLDHVIVSTDDPAIADAARAAGAEVPFLRPSTLATDEASPLDVLQHAAVEMEMHGVSADTLVLLQPTSPFRTAACIDDAIAHFERAAADTLTSITPAPTHPYWTWKADGDLIQPYFDRAAMQLQRTGLPLAYVETGTIYVVRREVLAQGSLYGERIVGFPIPSLESLDIDTADDFAEAERIIAMGEAPAP